MIEANQAIFSFLDDFCARRGLALANTGNPRWIGSEPKHRHFLTSAVLGETMSFSASRKLARFHLSTKSYFCAIGFDQDVLASGAIEHDLDPAFLTVALYELKPRPSGGISSIRQVVEAGDRRDPAYIGHNFDDMASLFPAVRFFESPERNEDETWSVFFRTCVDECDYGPSWIEEVLASTLRSLCDLDPRKIPYRVLCRSIFDGDPSSFFLAQYRCLEALYAYSSAEDIRKVFGLKKDWGDIATVLEDCLGWHPREEVSLYQLLTFASLLDLQAIVDATHDPSGSQHMPDQTRQAAKRIYWLRNSIVHYRPSQNRISLERLDWSTICRSMAGIIVDVYGSVFRV